MTTRRRRFAGEKDEIISQHVPCEFVIRSGKNTTQMSEESEAAASRRRSGKRPFIFGVSGHRDLVHTDLPELGRQLCEIFDRFMSVYRGAEFELLTPLAEGADRAAAEVALAAGIRLVVPMPMPRQEYERDFATADSLADFRRLLGVAEAVFELPNTDADGVSLKDSKARAERYAAVGDYIAQRSNVLILLWDGQDNEKVGGTAWVKKRRDYWTSETERGPGGFGYAGTIQIVTPRHGSTGMAAVRPRIEILGELPQVAQ
jgi:hypothetical protein